MVLIRKDRSFTGRLDWLSTEEMFYESFTLCLCIACTYFGVHMMFSAFHLFWFFLSFILLSGVCLYSGFRCLSGGYNETTVSKALDDFSQCTIDQFRKDAVAGRYGNHATDLL